MAAIVTKVVSALQKAGITAEAAFPGSTMPNITGPRAAVSLEKLEYTARTATVLVTVMVPASQGGGACEDAAIQVGGILEELNGICVQEECCFNSYADAFYVRVLGTFRGEAVMDSWASASDFSVEVGGRKLKNAVSFRAEQAVDAVTGTPLSTAVWTFRIVEEFGRGEPPMPPVSEPFEIDVSRSTGVETYTDCVWIACQVENTRTGMRQIRRGISKNRSEIVIM